jgi:hypothetical protein
MTWVTAGDFMSPLEKATFCNRRDSAPAGAQTSSMPNKPLMSLAAVVFIVPHWSVRNTRLSRITNSSEANGTVNSRIILVLLITNLENSRGSSWAYASEKAGKRTVARLRDRNLPGRPQEFVSFQRLHSPFFG